MVCFDIEIAFPIPSRIESLKAYVRRIEHIRRHYNGDTLEKTKKGQMIHHRYALCDEEAVGFLRDLPQPTFCVKIGFLRSDVLLYTNYKYTRQYMKPPKMLLLKKVYWLASSLEKWQPPHSFQKVGI